MAKTEQEQQSLKKGPSPLRSIIAGSTAGAVEIGMWSAMIEDGRDPY